MSRKIFFAVSTFCLLVFAVAIFASVLHAAGPTGHHSGMTTLKIKAIDVSESLTLGQDKGPGFFERMKRSIQNWARDEEEVEERPTVSPQVKATSVTETSVPMTPPKPITALDVRNSTTAKTTSTMTGEMRVSVVETNRSDMPATSSREPSRELRSTQLEERMAQAEHSSRTPSSRENVSTSENNTLETLGMMRNRFMVDYNALPEETTYVDDYVPAHRSDRQRVVSRSQDNQDNRDDQFRETQRHTKVYSVQQNRPSNGTNPTRETTRHENLQREDIQYSPYRSRLPATPQAVSVDSENEDAFLRTNRQSLLAKSAMAESDSTNGSYRASSDPSPIGGIRVDSRDNDDPWNRAAMGSKTGSANRELTATSRLPQSPQAQTQQHRSQTRYPRPGETLASSTDKPAEKKFETDSGREKALLVSPLIEVETEGDSRIIVGQESTYRIRLRNRGGAHADQVVLTVDVPNWIDILPPDVSTGTTSIVPKGANKDSRDFVWKISRVDAMSEEQIVLHLVPLERKTVDLRIKYDFHRSTAVARIEVQEPIIKMELQGPDEVLCGTKVGYKLLVKNIGNGDAEKLNLELLQTGSDMKSCPLPLLQAGEEQEIDVDVWTGKQDHIDINILATGAYDLTASVSKRVSVLKPDVSVSVESAETLFVDSPAEFHVIVRNDGTAAADNLELAATIPLGARYVSSDPGGRATPQNQVFWTISRIDSGEEFATTIICEPKREGLCKLDVLVNDANGLLASCTGTINAEAIADLRMEIENPNGPIEVGNEAVFTINVVNRGTKTAEDVEVVAAFSRGLEPYAIEGGNGTMSDGQVIFDKIPTISAGQTITLKVKGKAESAGNHRMRTEVICNAVNTHLIYEQMTYFYQKYKNRNSTVADSRTNDKTTSVPIPLHPGHGEIEPQPLRKAPPPVSTARQNDSIVR